MPVEQKKQKLKEMKSEGPAEHNEIHALRRLQQLSWVAITSQCVLADALQVGVDENDSDSEVTTQCHFGTR